ncbi:tRNA uracil 4-sulfurtransferase ThiI [Tenuibacillus multivorans]|uniref:Probable tRNA sulfurtransferase n=1 Tax=Tenuibacillus multivorans TaxID=237069 RepID=A0A1H0EGX9_9BACI|nr:tRNA uracil 4-sulfurtransferase ThiI [Tenuibacillus multivorans]GEL77161.1 putative tRNA sulfurtransferase [Tenuibacillus multivorans]SDN81694.1 thiamine biosynthesis protein ThiI [Tenuibacillus multivorans]
MKYDHILVRYGELALKGKNKKSFIQILKRNVERKLSAFPNIKVKAKRDHMYILLNGEDHEPILENCKDIIGIQSFSLAMKVENEEEKIKAGALKALILEEGQTFKITAKRPNKDFPISSQDMNQILGGHLLRNTNGWSVDVHEPDVEIRVEIRHDATYITSKKIEGQGGLPVGTTGKSLLLMSGGIDSPVAGYLAMNRGVEIEAIHFHSPPFTSDRAKQKVEDLARVLTKYGGDVKVHFVPFTEIQQKIFQEAPENYGMTIMRRLMMRISEMVAKNRDILSLTTGESLGQVASQTMESMHAINEVTNYPIIRPLVAMDKVDIIDISKEIGAYEISIRPYEDCCTIFVPKAPKTRPRREKVNEFERPIDFSEDIEKALSEIETVSFSASENESEEEFEDLL